MTLILQVGEWCARCIQALPLRLQTLIRANDCMAWRQFVGFVCSHGVRNAGCEGGLSILTPAENQVSRFSVSPRTQCQLFSVHSRSHAAHGLVENIMVMVMVMGWDGLKN